MLTTSTGLGRFAMPELFPFSRRSPMRDHPGRPTVAEVSLAALAGQLPPGRARCVGPGVRVHGGGEGRRLRPRRGGRGARVPRGGRGGAWRVDRRRGRRARAARGRGAPIVVLGGAFPGEERGGRRPRPRRRGVDRRGGACARAAARAAGRTVPRAREGRHRHDPPRRATARASRALGAALRADAAARASRACSRTSPRPTTSTAAAVRAQLARFARRASRRSATLAFRPPHVHLANSAAVLSEPGDALHDGASGPDALRLRAGAAPGRRVRAAPAHALPHRASRRRVVSPAGTPVGYGGTFVAARVEPDRDAPDRLRRRLPSRWLEPRARCWCAACACRWRGGSAWITSMLDVTDVPGVAPATRWSLFGRQGGGAIDGRRGRRRGATRSPTRC